MAAGMFMSAYSFGTFLGPTIGGIVFDYIEQTESAESFACTSPEPHTEKLNPCANQYAFR